MIRVLGFDGSPFAQDIHCDAGGDRFIRAFYQLQITGSYTTNGDPLDLSNAGGTPALPNGIPAAVSKGAVQIYIDGRGPATGFTGSGGYVDVVSANSDAPLTFSDLTNGNIKLKFLKNSAGSIVEYSAGAYGTDVTGDIFTMEVLYAR